MAVSFRVPDHWQDWVSWVLGFWLLLSPWILGYSDDTSATRNAVIIGFVLIFSEAITLSAFRPWEEWVSAGIGAWLIASPFIWHMQNPIGIANTFLVGGVVLLLAGYEILWGRSLNKSRP